MTVRQLISVLRKLDPDQIVVMRADTGRKYYEVRTLTPEDVRRSGAGFVDVEQDEVPECVVLRICHMVL